MVSIHKGYRTRDSPRSPDLEGKIRAIPLKSAETFEIIDGCKDPKRNFDVPTGQTFSNGVVLHYTPKETPPTPPQKRRKVISARTSTRKRRLEEAEDIAAGHQGLGVLDILPVSPQVIFTHGEDRGIFENSFIHFMRGLARSHPTLAFRKDRCETDSYPERLWKRTAAFNYFYNDAYSSVQALGGQGLGARAAARASAFSANKNLILWSYPLLWGSTWSKDELLALSEDTRVLFIKGDKDWLAPELLINSVRRQMKAQTWMITVRDTDHDFNFRTKLEEEKMCNTLGVITGTWLGGDNGTTWGTPIPWDAVNSKDMDLEWSPVSEDVLWGVWQWKSGEPSQQGVAVRVSPADDSKLSFHLEP